MFWHCCLGRFVFRLFLFLFGFVGSFAAGGRGFFDDLLDDECVVGEKQNVTLVEEPEEVGCKFGG
ncbi:MAG: hypothetical protein RLY69_82, partial [Verrucomicrobiota bacterium]